jgi:hypothetical protein
MNNHIEENSMDFSWRAVFINIALALVFSWLLLTIKGSLKYIIVINEFIGSVIGSFLAALLPALVVTIFFTLVMPKTFLARRCFVIVLWLVQIVMLNGILKIW